MIKARRGPVVLIGMMGAGKTTLGKRLARETGREFIDLDKEIELRSGVSVATIFEIEGERGFRWRESCLLAEVLADEKWIIATGGGVVLDPVNRSRLLAVSPVFYLKASPGLLYSRTRNDKSRPLLQVADPFERIKTLVRQREPLYKEVADIVVETSQEMVSVIDSIKTVMAK